MNIIRSTVLGFLAGLFVFYAAVAAIAPIREAVLPIFEMTSSQWVSTRGLGISAVVGVIVAVIVFVVSAVYYARR